MEFQPNKELILKLAEASGWAIPDERLDPLLAEYKGIFTDSRALRQFEPAEVVPADIYEAE